MGKRPRTYKGKYFPLVLFISLKAEARPLSESNQEMPLDLKRIKINANSGEWEPNLGGGYLAVMSALSLPGRAR